MSDESKPWSPPPPTAYKDHPAKEVGRIEDALRRVGTGVISGRKATVYEVARLLLDIVDAAVEAAMAKRDRRSE